MVVHAYQSQCLGTVVDRAVSVGFSMSQAFTSYLRSRRNSPSVSTRLQSGT